MDKRDLNKAIFTDKANELIDFATFITNSFENNNKMIQLIAEFDTEDVLDYLIAQIDFVINIAQASIKNIESSIPVVGDCIEMKLSKERELGKIIQAKTIVDLLVNMKLAYLSVNNPVRHIEIMKILQQINGGK